MPTRDRLLAVLVAVLWGLNFLAIHATLGRSSRARCGSP
jgi:O-acetylserine/cysteine efflux transporter